MNEMSRKPAHTVAELASDRQHQENWPAIMEVGDDELLVRASAVLKSQGPENWSHGRPGLLRARTNSRSVRDASCGKIRRGKNRRWGGVMWRRRSGVLVVFFSFVNGGRDLSQHIKSVSFGQRRPRSRGEPSSRPAPAWRQRRASVSDQVGRPVRVQCAHPQLVATQPAPVLASGTIGVGWVGRGRGRGASASGPSCVASQGRRHRLGHRLLHAQHQCSTDKGKKQNLGCSHGDPRLGWCLAGAH